MQHIKILGHLRFIIIRHSVVIDRSDAKVAWQKVLNAVVVVAISCSPLYQVCDDSDEVFFSPHIKEGEDWILQHNRPVDGNQDIASSPHFFGKFGLCFIQTLQGEIDAKQGE